MTQTAEDPHLMLRALQAQAADQDDLMRDLVAALREISDARSELEMLARQQAVVRAARTALIVEAASLLLEREHQAEIVTLARFRRPRLRLVQ